MAGAERQGMQQLQHRRGGETRHDADQAPAQDAGEAAKRHQAKRSHPRHQRRALPEQHDLGDDAFGP